MRDHQVARPMDLYNKIDWAIFSLPRYLAQVGPLYYFILSDISLINRLPYRSSFFTVTLSALQIVRLSIYCTYEFRRYKNWFVYRSTLDYVGLLLFESTSIKMTGHPTQRTSVLGITAYWISRMNLCLSREENIDTRRHWNWEYMSVGMR